MAIVKRFEELMIWQKARELCQDVYRITHYELFSKDYKLRDQINASSGSVMDNIAEGYERNGNKEFVQFLYIAKGSCGETRSQLYRAFDRKYIHQPEFEALLAKAEFLSKSIMNFIQYLKKSEVTGTKFKT